MKNWTIGQRVSGGFTIMVAILIAIGAFANWRVRQLASEFNQVATESVPAFAHLAQAESLSNATFGIVYKHIASPSADDMKILESEMSANGGVITKELADYEGLSVSREAREALAKVRTARERYRKLRDDLVELSRSATTPEASAKVNARARAELDPLAAAYIAAFQEAMRVEKREVDEVSVATGHHIRATTVALLAFATCGAVVAVGLAVVTIRGTNRALRTIAGALG
ncbi:MAG TPA: MCP four helix bundle domain-containing protein, partial [Acidobacteriota bacterium]|nr:MCP four helix bundle domain-containing protein [Acidobacteriota bacterium]